MKRNLMNELTEGVDALAKIKSLQKQLDESITMAEMLAATIKKLQNELDKHNARVHKLSLEEWRTYDQS